MTKPPPKAVVLPVYSLSQARVDTYRHNNQPVIRNGRMVPVFVGEPVDYLAVTADRLEKWRMEPPPGAAPP